MGSGQGRFLLVNVYLEQTENLKRTLDGIKMLLLKYLIPIIVVGDFNAKHRAWGSSEQDSRGGKIMDFIIINALELHNQPSLGPTFWTTRAEGFIDLTMSKNFDNCQWNILKEDSLNDHRLITLRNSAMERANVFPCRFNWKRTNLTSFEKIITSGHGGNLATRFQSLPISACEGQSKKKEPKHNDDIRGLPGGIMS